MKKSLYLIGLSVLLTLVSCNEQETPVTPDVPPVVVEDDIRFEISKADVKIKDTRVDLFDYTSLFKIYNNGKEIKVEKDYIDTSDLQNNNEYARIVLRYEGKVCYKDIEIIPTVYEINTKVLDVELKESEVATYDFNSCFEYYIDGELSEITSDMIQNNVESASGTYTYTVSKKDETKTLNVYVIPDHVVEIVTSYNSKDVEISTLKSLNLKDAFLIYLDKSLVEVQDEYLKYSFDNAQVGDKLKVSCSYRYDNAEDERSITLNIVEDTSYVVTTYNKTTYPNDAPIDFRSLFKIEKGDEVLDVKLEDITGKIDLSTPGEYKIILHFNDQDYTSIVTVVHGVVLKQNEEVKKVRLGTNMSTYDFEDDVTLMINGVRYLNIPDSYFDFSNVDFNQVGTYTVKLTIPYNDQKLTLTGAKFSYYELLINYEVVEDIYSIDVLNDYLEIDQNTNIFDNIEVSLNGIKCSVYNDADTVTYVRNVYGKLVNPIDYSSYGIQNIEIEVYPYKNNLEYFETVSFKVLVKQDLDIESTPKVIYTGQNFYAGDLFKISKAGEEIPVTLDLITGYVDINTPGVYDFTLTYEGLSKTSSVTVYDAKMVGTFKTLLMTIGSEEEIDDEGLVIEEGTKSSKVSDFVIHEDGTMTFGSYNVKVIESIDLNTMELNIQNYEYLLHYQDGILFLNPLNSEKLSFTNYKRPLVFFNEDVYQIDSKFTINYATSGYVLDLDGIITYSIDVFRLTNKQTQEHLDYALKVYLKDKTSSDTVYVVEAGACQFLTDFDASVSSSGTLYFNDTKYNFTVKNITTGNIVRSSVTSTPYNSKIFNGTDGTNQYTLNVSSSGTFTFKVNNKVVLTKEYDAILKQDVGGIDLDTNTVYLTTSSYGTYKFVLNLEDNSLTFINKDKYLGNYVCDSTNIILDGYQNGWLTYNKVTYPLTYEVIGNNVTINFTKDKDEKIIFYLPDIYNSLSVISSSLDAFDGKEFINEEITIGAVVSFDTFIYGRNTSADAIYNAITIQTKDGKFDLETLKTNIPGTNIKYVDKSKVYVGKPGYYLVQINLPIDDKIITMNYAIQIVDKNTKVSDDIGSFVGIFDSNLNLSIDEFGICKVSIDGLTYQGLLRVNSDNSFYASCYNATKGNLKLICDKISKNIYYVKITGSVNLVDYVTSYQIKSAQSEKYILRELYNDTEKVYLFGKVGSINLEIVTLDLISDNKYELTYADGKKLIIVINGYTGSQTDLSVEE